VVKAAQVWREVCHGLGIKAWRMRVIHFAAFRIRTRGLSITVAVRYRLKIQTFAARYFWEMAWRDTVLIGNLPTSLLPLSRHAFRPGIWSTAFWGFLPKLFRLQTKHASFLSLSCPCCHTAAESQAL
jgi:hypothetical protein